MLNHDIIAILFVTLCVLCDLCGLTSFSIHYKQAQQNKPLAGISARGYPCGLLLTDLVANGA